MFSQSAKTLPNERPGVENSSDCVLVDEMTSQTRGTR